MPSRLFALPVLGGLLASGCAPGPAATADQAPAHGGNHRPEPAPRYDLGLVGYVGDPPVYRASVRVTKEGSRTFVMTLRGRRTGTGPASGDRADAAQAPAPSKTSRL